MFKFLTGLFKKAKLKPLRIEQSKAIIAQAVEEMQSRKEFNETEHARIQKQIDKLIAKQEKLTVENTEAELMIDIHTA